MEYNYVLLVSLSLVVLSVARTEASECKNGWRPYKDDSCVKVFPSLLSYDEAQRFCASQGSEVSHASLVMVKDEDMQLILEDYSKDIVNTLWLGGKYVEGESQYRWTDGAALTYTNWQEDYPLNTTNEAACIELRPNNLKTVTQSGGKWAHVACNKLNQVICQRTISWTLKDAVTEIINMRKQLLLSTDERNELREEVATTRQSLAATDNALHMVEESLQAARVDIQTASSRAFPVGAVYIEYYNQPSPPMIWPEYTWQEITGTYAGLFFRAAGSGSGDWGETQPACAPRVDQMEFTWRGNDRYPTHIDFPFSGWTEWGHAGESYHGCSCQDYHAYMALRYYTKVCEVRPKNQAVRIWKRIR